MRRRTIALVLTLVPFLAASCGGGGSDGDEVDAGACPVDALESATAPVDIVYWFSGLAASNIDAMNELVADYNGSQDKVRVKAQFQGTYDEGSDKYLTALRGGSLPNVILLEETRLQLMIDSGSMVPAQACIEAEDYDLSDHLDAALEGFRVDGELWPMPFNLSQPVLYFDTNDFTEAGLDPADPPKTFDAVLEASRKIKASGAAGTGFAWEMQPWYVEQWFAKAGEPIVDHENGRSGRAEEAMLANETGEEIFRFMEAMFAEDLALNVGRNTSGADALFALGKGDAAMTIGTSAALGSIFDIQAAGQFTDVGVGVAPLFGPDADDGGVQVGGGALFMVAKGHTDAERAATWDFARWLNEPEQQARWHERTGYIPIRKSSVDMPEVAKLWQDRPTFRVAYDQLAASKAAFGGPSIGPYEEVRDAIRTALESLVLRKTSPADALAQAQKAADAALTSYNERVGD